MSSCLRRSLALLIAVTTILAASCNGESGVGMGAPLGARQKWGGGSSGPGVVVMGGGPVYR